MCKVTTINVDDRKVHIAELKLPAVKNIIEVVRQNDLFDKVILFGSATGDRCKEDSDIDIAVFGTEPTYQMLRSKKYLDFTNAVRGFGDGRQSYDILYFKTGTKDNRFFIDEVGKGEVLYERA